MTAMWPAHLAVPPLLRSPAVSAGQKSRTLLLSTSLNIGLRLNSTTTAYICDICHFFGVVLNLKKKKVQRLCNSLESLAQLWLTEIVW